ncbi:unnamed protein product [Amoebophrya sp. A25]|nr:unnamed protein product [Amoebophrya sp. A25]|eukprot:GSA25T00020561001.1
MSSYNNTNVANYSYSSMASGVLPPGGASKNRQFPPNYTLGGSSGSSAGKSGPMLKGKKMGTKLLTGSKIYNSFSSSNSASGSAASGMGVGAGQHVVNNSNSSNSNMNYMMNGAGGSSSAASSSSHLHGQSQMNTFSAFNGDNYGTKNVGGSYNSSSYKGASCSGSLASMQPSSASSAANDDGLPGASQHQQQQGGTLSTGGAGLNPSSSHQTSQHLPSTAATGTTASSSASSASTSGGSVPNSSKVVPSPPSSNGSGKKSMSQQTKRHLDNLGLGHLEETLVADPDYSDAEFARANLAGATKVGSKHQHSKHGSGGVGGVTPGDGVSPSGKSKKNSGAGGKNNSNKQGTVTSGIASIAKANTTVAAGVIPSSILGKSDAAIAEAEDQLAKKAKKKKATRGGKKQREKREMTTSTAATTADGTEGAEVVADEGTSASATVALADLAGDATAKTSEAGSSSPTGARKAKGSPSPLAKSGDQVMNQVLEDTVGSSVVEDGEDESSAETTTSRVISAKAEAAVAKAKQLLAEDDEDEQVRVPAAEDVIEAKNESTSGPAEGAAANDEEDKKNNTLDQAEKVLGVVDEDEDEEAKSPTSRSDEEDASVSSKMTSSKQALDAEEALLRLELRVTDQANDVHGLVEAETNGTATKETTAASPKVEDDETVRTEDGATALDSKVTSSSASSDASASPRLLEGEEKDAAGEEAQTGPEDGKDLQTATATSRKERKKAEVAASAGGGGGADTPHQTDEEATTPKKDTTKLIEERTMSRETKKLHDTQLEDADVEARDEDAPSEEEDEEYVKVETTASTAGATGTGKAPNKKKKKKKKADEDFKCIDEEGKKSAEVRENCPELAMKQEEPAMKNATKQKRERLERQRKRKELQEKNKEEKRKEREKEQAGLCSERGGDLGFLDRTCFSTPTLPRDERRHLEKLGTSKAVVVSDSPDVETVPEALAKLSKEQTLEHIQKTLIHKKSEEQNKNYVRHLEIVMRESKRKEQLERKQRIAAGKSAQALRKEKNQEQKQELRRAARERKERRARGVDTSTSPEVHPHRMSTSEIAKGHTGKTLSESQEVDIDYLTAVRMQRTTSGLVGRNSKTRTGWQIADSTAEVPVAPSAKRNAKLTTQRLGAATSNSSLLGSSGSADHSLYSNFYPASTSSSASVTSSKNKTHLSGRGGLSGAGTSSSVTISSGSVSKLKAAAFKSSTTTTTSLSSSTVGAPGAAQKKLHLTTSSSSTSSGITGIAQQISTSLAASALAGSTSSKSTLSGSGVGTKNTRDREDDTFFHEYCTNYSSIPTSSRDWKRAALLQPVRSARGGQKEYDSPTVDTDEVMSSVSFLKFKENAEAQQRLEMEKLRLTPDSDDVDEEDEAKHEAENYVRGKLTGSLGRRLLKKGSESGSGSTTTTGTTGGSSSQNNVDNSSSHPASTNVDTSSFLHFPEGLHFQGGKKTTPQELDQLQQLRFLEERDGDEDDDEDDDDTEDETTREEQGAQGQHDLLLKSLAGSSSSYLHMGRAAGSGLSSSNKYNSCLTRIRKKNNIIVEEDDADTSGDNEEGAPSSTTMLSIAAARKKQHHDIKMRELLLKASSSSASTKTKATTSLTIDVDVLNKILDPQLNVDDQVENAIKMDAVDVSDGDDEDATEVNVELPNSLGIDEDLVGDSITEKRTCSSTTASSATGSKNMATSARKKLQRLDGDEDICSSEGPDSDRTDATIAFLRRGTSMKSASAKGASDERAEILRKKVMNKKNDEDEEEDSHDRLVFSTTTNTNASRRFLQNKLKISSMNKDDGEDGQQQDDSFSSTKRTLIKVGEDPSDPSASSKRSNSKTSNTSSSNSKSTKIPEDKEDEDHDDDFSHEQEDEDHDCDSHITFSSTKQGGTKDELEQLERLGKVKSDLRRKSGAASALLHEEVAQSSEADESSEEKLSEELSRSPLRIHCVNRGEDEA